MGFEQHGVLADKHQPRILEGADLRYEKGTYDEMCRLLDARSAVLDHEILEQIQEKYPGYTGEKPVIESFTHNNLDIQFVGVVHTVETLALFRKEIEAQIANADLVIFEGSVETSGEAERAERVHNREITFSGGSTIMQFPNYEINSNSGMAFFYEMENLAKKHKKQLVNLDPYSDYRFLQSIVNDDGAHGKQLFRLNEEIQAITKIVANAGDFTTQGYLGTGIALGLREAVSLIKDGPETTEESLHLNRRKFLGQTGALVAGAALGQVVSMKARENDAVIKYEPDPGQRWAQYNLTDFRDVAIATGIDRLSQRFQRKMKVAIVYGGYHENGVRRYLENPTLREAKRSLYKPFSDIAPPELTSYKYVLSPEVLANKVSLSTIPEDQWGRWQEVVRTRI